MTDTSKKSKTEIENISEEQSETTLVFFPSDDPVYNEMKKVLGRVKVFKKPASEKGVDKTNIMVSNQIEFNKKYNNKEVKEIEIEDEYDFEGQLTIEDYPSLEKLYLHDVDSIEKITLKNLPQLQECTIWDCGLIDLVIENCPNIRKLNFRKNSLTSLDFLNCLSLSKLKELEVESNPEIDKILEPYNGNWKVWLKEEMRKLKRYQKRAGYDIQSSIQKNEKGVESKTSLKEEDELKAQIETPPKSGN